MGVYFSEILSHIPKLTSVRLIISLATNFDLEIEHMDVKTTFLHGDLEKEFCMKQLKGFTGKGDEKFVCKLKKSLYGLKQSPRMWY